MFLEPDAVSVIGRQYAIYVCGPYAPTCMTGRVGIHRFDVSIKDYAAKSGTSRAHAKQYINYIQSCFVCINYTTQRGEVYKNDMFSIACSDWRILDCRVYSQAVHEGAVLLRYYFEQRRAFRTVLRHAGLDAGTAHMIAAEFFPSVKI